MRITAFILVAVLASLGLVLYGGMVMVSPGILLDSFSHYVYVFPAGALQAIGYQLALFRLLGYFNLLLGAAALVLLFLWTREHKASLLKAVFAVIALAYLGPVVFDNTVGHVGLFEIIESVLMAAVLVTGVLVLFS